MISENCLLLLLLLISSLDYLIMKNKFTRSPVVDSVTSILLTSQLVVEMLKKMLNLLLLLTATPRHSFSATLGWYNFWGLGTRMNLTTLRLYWFKTLRLLSYSWSSSNTAFLLDDLILFFVGFKHFNQCFSITIDAFFKFWSSELALQIMIFYWIG